jgi:hypothetical protein
MGHDGLYDTLLLLGLLWLSMYLYWVWLRGRNGTHPPTPTPTTSIQKRSKRAPTLPWPHPQAALRRV